ncbi:hypothetical protein FDP41_000353 [Naegleria fowleri]|uniref:ALA-interacting subunit n=1 Tax=Naegleria fowleri TaxID=5763 RepID=A0A6A5CD21_NAEFO|nr:uncharacterized protein FDP41_000353 [Naegleria fowleri]KAF0984454.1 hypothetical protein FDP41_000353 [Naegleria fowleri]CAG4716660.1 unnamed protein product [Naegleria fowleri]
MPEEVKKSKKPRDFAFTQQRLPAWQPILSPPWVIVCFLAITVVFIPIGVAILVTTQNVQEYVKQYDGDCILDYTPSNLPGRGPYCESTTSIHISSRMDPPIYMYYSLENFYQNHRRYTSSRNDIQLAGDNTITPASANSDCYPIVFYGPDQTNMTDSIKNNANMTYSPCGLIAWSMFNDTISLFGPNNTLVCDGQYHSATSNCTKKGIAWSSDVDVKFKAPKSPALNRVAPTEYYGEPGHALPTVTDEDFIVWMRTSALPTFRKLYRIINVPLEPGTYTFKMQQRFNVSTFDGKKYVVLTTSSWIGGRNLFLAIAYLVVGGVSFILACVFAVGAIIQKFRLRKQTTA